MEELFLDSDIEIEYNKALRLNAFSKLCAKLRKDKEFDNYFRKMFRQSHNQKNTVTSIVNKEFGFEIADKYQDEFLSWVIAYFHKTNIRKPIPNDVVRKLEIDQNNRCAICCCELNEANGKAVDHIIPYKLVGDELEENYQLLCTSCNSKKNAKTDYILKSLLKLN